MNSASGCVKFMSSAALIVSVPLFNMGLALASPLPPPAHPQADKPFLGAYPSDRGLELQGYVPPDNGAPEGTEGAGTR